MSLSLPGKKVRGRRARGVYHESYDEPDAEQVYDPRAVLDTPAEFPQGYMPAEVCQDCARRLHYAHYRTSRAASDAERRLWRRHGEALRDRILLGNLKLVYKAVRYRKAWRRWADDLVGEGVLILMRAIDSYDPWYGVRFGSYAFTCLIRAFVRRAYLHALAATRLAAVLSHERTALEFKQSPSESPSFDWERYLSPDHPLLSDREKNILQLRFGLGGTPALKLRALAQRFGLSKERVRQIQVVALAKLRQAVDRERKALWI